MPPSVLLANSNARSHLPLGVFLVRKAIIWLETAASDGLSLCSYAMSYLSVSML